VTSTLVGPELFFGSVLLILQFILPYHRFFLRSCRAGNSLYEVKAVQVIVSYVFLNELGNNSSALHTAGRVRGFEPQSYIPFVAPFQLSAFRPGELL
jgi:hypothetical protein